MTKYERKLKYFLLLIFYLIRYYKINTNIVGNMFITPIKMSLQPKISVS